MLSFIHLSDIHFTKCSGDQFDVDDDLRNEILLDITHNFVNKIVNPCGILICGDIAYSGQKKEYEAALEFINKICNITKIPQDAIYCVPGNHDIDQKIPNNIVTVKALQDSLANTQTIVQYDDQLSKILRNDDSAALLYMPICNYNSFAKKYNCHLNIGQNALGWERILQLTDTYSLCILGLNSTFISNADDHATTDERLMKMSTMQIPKRKDNTIFLTLCHHPPECWDKTTQDIQNALNERIHVQLYGHKHTQSIKVLEKGVIINSGATHPSRWEHDWIPRYNWVSLDIESKDGHDYLSVMIFPRIYSPSTSAFEHDTSLSMGKCLQYTFDLSSNKLVNNNHKTTDSECIKNDSLSEFWAINIDQLSYDFINLPIERRNAILKKFKLCRDEDISKAHAEILHDIINTAKETMCLQALVEEVSKYKQ